MSKLSLFSSWSVLMSAVVILAGCSKPQPNQESTESHEAASEQSAAMDHMHGEASDAEHSEHAGHSDYEEALAELSPEDRALAEKQQICPVSDHPLGSMGKPYKVTVQDREVFLCCQGCEAAIKDNPEKYLAKLSP